MTDLDPKYLVDTLNANIDNTKMSDARFREFLRNTLPLYKGSVEKTDEPTG